MRNIWGTTPLAAGCASIALALFGCEGSELGPPAGFDPIGDAATDAGDDVAEDVLEDGTDAVDDDVDESDADDNDSTATDTGPVSDVITTEPGVFELGTADLGDEYVFKGVWAGSPGEIVAVGNDGVVARRDAAGAWELLTKVEGAELLNAVHGVDRDNLWAVGRNGAIVGGSVDAFGASLACEQNADCNDLDSCTVDVCVGGTCEAEPSGAPGCCGTDAAFFDFEDGGDNAFRSQEIVGTLEWNLVMKPGRATSGVYSLYFGDPILENYATGEQVAATALSPEIKLPATGNVTLSFQVYMDTETDSNFDKLEVQVEAGASIVTVWQKAELVTVPTGGFVLAEADISAFRGQNIRLRFRFDSGDGSFNDTEGVYIDDIRVATSCTAGGDASGATGPTLWGTYAVTEDNAYAVGRAGAILAYDGTSWGEAETVSQDSVWNAVWGVGDTLALVGNGGAAVVNSPAGLTNVDTGTGIDLRGVHTADGVVFWSVGDASTIFRGDANGNWSPEVVPGVSRLWDVFAASNDDVYAVGDSGTILHYDGAAWSIIGAPTTLDLKSVWVDGSGVVTITGADGVILEGDRTAGFTESGIFHLAGELVGLWGDDTGSVRVAVGSNGQILMNTAGGWAPSPSGTTQGLTAVFGFGEDDIWAVGRAGTALRYDGTVWTRVELPIPAAINAIWGSTPERIYAAGSGGVLLVWDGTAWTSLTSSTSANLRAVYGRAANDVWAVGQGATIMRYSGLGWAQTPVDVDEEGEDPVMNEMHAIWAWSADDAWAVGADGRVLRWDGALWVRQEMDWPITLRGIYGIAENDIWAVGNEGHIIHYNGESWEKIESGSVATLHAIHGDGANHVVVVGALGTVLTLSRDASAP